MKDRHSIVISQNSVVDWWTYGLDIKLSCLKAKQKKLHTSKARRYCLSLLKLLDMLPTDWWAATRWPLNIRCINITQCRWNYWHTHWSHTAECLKNYSSPQCRILFWWLLASHPFHHKFSHPQEKYFLSDFQGFQQCSVFKLVYSSPQLFCHVNAISCSESILLQFFHFLATCQEAVIVTASNLLTPTAFHIYIYITFTPLPKLNFNLR